MSVIKTLSAIKDLVKSIDDEEKQSGPNVSDIRKFEKTYNNVQKLVELQTNLKKLQKDQNNEPTFTDQQLVEQFKNWLAENGCKESLDKVKIVRTLAEGTGLIANSEIKEGDKFIQVPIKLFMSIETAYKAFGDKIAREPLFKYLPNMLLVVHLIQETLAKQSFWAPYLRMLPKTYKTALYLNMQDFNMLIGSPLLEEAINTYRNTLRQYCFLYDFFGKNLGIISTSNFTWELFVWAVSTMMSRQNQIPFTNTVPAAAQYVQHGVQHCLIPFWDLCNHVATGKITTFYEPDIRSLTCSAVKGFKAGDQVFINYGDRPNSQLLLYSGFCLKNNPFDTYKLKLQLENDALHHDKMHILEERGIQQSTSITLDMKSTTLPALLVPYMRVYAMSGELTGKIAPKLEPDHTHHDHSGCGHQPTRDAYLLIDEQNELAAYKSIVTVLKKKLAAYPTTQTEDEQMLSKNPANFIRYILYIRIAEKKILDRYIKLVESMIEQGVLTHYVEPEPEEEEECDDDHDDHEGHGHSHAGGHGHSHGGSGGHGHSHGSSGGHGHSHGGSGGGHGHSHGGSGGHGHSHGGSGGHGHSHGGSGGHGHSH